jgi:raffinose/stachyose/melibiose transport system permease protein
MVIYLAALQAIPRDMYEAVSLDGANRWQTLIHITLPNMLLIIQINMLLTISGALEAFNIPFVMTNSSPPTSTFLTTTINVAFIFNNFGLASAMAVVLLIIVFMVITIQQRLLGGGRDVV